MGQNSAGLHAGSMLKQKSMSRMAPITHVLKKRRDAKTVVHGKQPGTRAISSRCSDRVPLGASLPLFAPVWTVNVDIELLW